MRTPTGHVTPPRSVLMRVLVRSWEYRHPRVWADIRFACAVFNLFLGILLLAYAAYLGPLAWLAAIPLASSALIFWTGYQLQHSVAS